jgi:hypothetical protein
LKELPCHPYLGERHVQSHGPANCHGYVSTEPYFTIQKALTRKNIANDIYQHEWCPPSKDAIRLYTKAAKDMQTLLQVTYFNQVEK